MIVIFVLFFILDLFQNLNFWGTAGEIELITELNKTRSSPFRGALLHRYTI